MNALGFIRQTFKEKLKVHEHYKGKGCPVFRLVKMKFLCSTIRNTFSLELWLTVSSMNLP